MSQGWIDATQWLRTKSDDASYIYGAKFNCGVLSWWDYGYWIVREGHMPVLCSPGAGDRVLAAKIFTSKDDAYSINELIDHKIKYVVIDEEMLKAKRYAIFQYAGVEDSSDTFMDKLYNSDKAVFQSSEVKVFEFNN